MKKMIFAAMLIAGSGFIANAQVNVSINIGVQPAWGPVGYDYVRYYYLPDADAYYDVNNRIFIYFDGRGWIHSGYLPGRYRNMDFYHVHKIVINERDPWSRHSYYHNQYISYKGRRSQAVIRDARDQRYWQNPGHPRHKEWKGGNQGRGNGNGQGNTTVINRRPVYQNNGNSGNRGNDNRGGQGNVNRGNDNRGGQGNGNRGNDNRGGNDKHDKGGGDRGHGNGKGR